MIRWKEWSKIKLKYKKECGVRGNKIKGMEWTKTKK
jgi:hypothetical protein